MAVIKVTNDPWTPDSDDISTAGHTPSSAEAELKKENDTFDVPNTNSSTLIGFDDEFIPSQSLLTSGPQLHEQGSHSLQTCPGNPLYKFIDSERYIQSLEKKLEKISKGKGKNNGPTSKDIISSLAGFHDDQMKSFMDSNVTNSLSTCVDQGAPSSSLLFRKLYPEKQALNAEELLALIFEDKLDMNSEHQSSEKEESNESSMQTPDK